jgi:hypothetical protein
MKQSQQMQLLTSSATIEWYTPLEIIAPVVEVIGNIELDPAGNDFANTWIEAERMYAPPDNGLSHEWVAKSLFMNPPYGKYGNKSSQEVWMDYLISQLPTIGACIALTKTVPGYRWWDNLFNGKWPGHLCITSGRIWFVDVRGKVRGASKSASSFWYYGPDPEKFERVFSAIGRVLPPKEDIRIEGVIT